MTDGGITDVISQLSGIAPGTPLDSIRDRKTVTREYAQISFRALFEPAATDDVSLQERSAIATFVAGLHDQPPAISFYRAGLDRTAPPPAFSAALSAEIGLARATGPYGAYPEGPLSRENLDGPVYIVTHAAALGPRLAAALAHVHMLVFHPRDASPEALQALLDAGWSNTGIVTLSQLVAFLTFQIRVAAGLRTLAASAA